MTALDLKCNYCTWLIYSHIQDLPVVFFHEVDSWKTVGAPSICLKMVTRHSEFFSDYYASHFQSHHHLRHQFATNIYIFDWIYYQPVPSSQVRPLSQVEQARNSNLEWGRYCYRGDSLNAQWHSSRPPRQLTRVRWYSSIFVTYLCLETVSSEC